MFVVLSVILALFFHIIAAQTNPANFPGENCNRNCDAAESKICYFHFTLEYYHSMGPACKKCGFNSIADCFSNQCITGDGTPRGVMSINRQIPGPSIHVCQNDLIVVDVKNAMSGTGATIHWHGFHQKQTPFYDGAPFVTQCPIEFSSTFRYSFFAADVGTHWYHSHTGLGKLNGQYGGIVVRRPNKSDPNRNFFDEDLPEHLIIVSDWLEMSAEMIFPGLKQSPRGVLPDNLLINGRGVRRRVGNISTTSMPIVRVPIEVFRLEKMKRYRFRLVNTVSLICAVSLEIQNASLTVLSSDSYDIRPVEVERIVANSGERFDFVVTVDNDGDYWMRVRGLGLCELFNVEQYALLTTNMSANSLLPDISDIPLYNETLNVRNRTLNHPSTLCGDSGDDYCITDLMSYEPGKGIVDVEVDPKNQIYLGIQHVILRDTSSFFAGLNYEQFLSFNDDIIAKPSVNRISHVSPSISLLTQLDQLSSINFCNESSVPLRCRAKKYCDCVHLIKVPLNEVIELVVVDESTNRALTVDHPFHLHGNSMFVIEVGQNIENSPITAAGTRILRNQAHKLGLAKEKQFPVIKDTISVPAQGYTVFRFRADNPGFWLGHCHYSFHLAGGMAFILQVGETYQMPPPPPAFPQCGNFQSNNLVPELKPRWVKMTKTSPMPANCHVGGDEPPQMTYVGRKFILNEIFIGKVYSRSRKFCFSLFSWEGCFDDYEILCGGRVEWIPSTSDVSNFVNGGNETTAGKSTYVCRASLTILGKSFIIFGSFKVSSSFLDKQPCCNIFYSQKSYCIETFSALRIIN